MASMASMIIWLAISTVSISILVVTAAADSVFLNAFVAAAVSVTIAFLCLRDNQRALQANTNPHETASMNARYMASIWAWGALAIAAMYMSVIEWREWWHFVLAFSAAGVLCLCFANLLDSDEAKALSRDRVYEIARWLAIGQLGGMLIVMVGLVVDGKMDKLGLTFTGMRSNPPNDWPANNVFFFGAFALIMISWAALRTYRQASVQNRQRQA